MFTLISWTTIYLSTTHNSNYLSKVWEDPSWTCVTPSLAAAWPRQCSATRGRATSPPRAPRPTPRRRACPDPRRKAPAWFTHSLLRSSLPSMVNKGNKINSQSKFLTSMASKPINIGWIVTGSQSYWKNMYSILLRTFFRGKFSFYYPRKAVYNPMR